MTTAVSAPAPRVPWLAHMHPAYFAMVMATGIVSLGAFLSGWPRLAQTLVVGNCAFFVILVACLTLRCCCYPRQIIADLFNHGRCTGFFTIVAALGILGSQFLIIEQWARFAAAFWVAAIVLWIILTYTIFTILTVKKVKPTFPEGINGGWLLAVVASQAVAVLGAQLALPLGWTHGAVMFFCLSMWLGSGMFYVWIISLIFYRYMFFPLSPGDLSPPYWINMGAVAISALAGTMLIAAAPQSPLLTALLPFLKGATLLFWATATWWIPMLFILGIWRHLYSNFPLRYDPLYWGVVFPLGMYTVATIRISLVMPNAAFLMAIPRVFFYIALAAWLIIFLALVKVLLRALFKALSPSRRTPAAP